MRTLLVRTAALVAFASLVIAAMQATHAQTVTGGCMFEPQQWMGQQWQGQQWQGQQWSAGYPAPTSSAAPTPSPTGSAAPSPTASSQTQMSTGYGPGGGNWVQQGTGYGGNGAGGYTGPCGAAPQPT